MSDIMSLRASVRARGGKGPARAARRDGLVPAIIYGNNEAPLMINVERRLLETEVHKPGFFTRLYDIEIDGASYRALPRDVQFHPVNDLPIHADFLRFSAERLVMVMVPVQFINEEASPGLKRGGMLNIVRHEVEVETTADKIPHALIIDLTGLAIGDSIHASSVPLPDGVAYTITDRDFTIATIAAPTVVAAEAQEAQEAPEPAAPAEQE